MSGISLSQSRSIAATIVKVDPRFRNIVTKAGPAPIGLATTVGQSRHRRSNFQALAESILSQQLSTKAARKIKSRVADISGGRLRADRIANLRDKDLRNAGCSGAKSRALRELAIATTDGVVPMRTLHLRQDEEIFEILTPLYGIGRWTVEMFLMFQLGRLDIWPVGDLGVRRGWERIHQMRGEIEPQQLAKKGSPFAPYRSHVAWFCWRALEEK